MPELALDCPYCDAQRTGFAFYTEVRLSSRPPHFWRSFWLCRRCREGVVVTLAAIGHAQNTPAECQGDLLAFGFKVVAVHPKPKPTVAPDHVPEAVAREYVEATESLRRKAYTSAGMMYRRVLLTTTTSLASGTDIKFKKRDTLEFRIDALAIEHLITPAMREWADIVRLDGNLAEHGEEEPFTQSDAEQMQYFTELLLNYAFTLPERVRLARAKNAEDG